MGQGDPGDPGNLSNILHLEHQEYLKNTWLPMKDLGGSDS